MIATVNWFDAAACVLAGFGAGLILRPLFDRRLGLTIAMGTVCSACGFKANLDVQSRRQQDVNAAVDTAWTLIRENHARKCSERLEVL